MPFINFSAVRRIVPIRFVLDRINWRATTRYVGFQLRGRCPLHGSTNTKSRSFAVNLRQGKWWCHGCKQGGDAVDLWARLLGLDLVTAAIRLCNAYGVEIPTIPGTEKRNGKA